MPSLQELLGVAKKGVDSLSSLLGIKPPTNDLGSLLGINTQTSAQSTPAGFITPKTAPSMQFPVTNTPKAQSVIKKEDPLMKKTNPSGIFLAKGPNNTMISPAPGGKRFTMDPAMGETKAINTLSKTPKIIKSAKNTLSIHPEDIGKMEEFVDYVRGKFPENQKLELAAADIIGKYKLKVNEDSLRKIATSFQGYLKKLGK